MKYCCVVLFFLCCGIKVAAQADTIRPIRFIPAGSFAPLPYSNVVSYLVTTHSSAGTEVNIYHEAKIRGNIVPDYWRQVMSKLPSGSIIIYSNVVVMENGVRKLFPDVEYRIQ